MGAPVSTGGGDASGDFAHLVSASSSTNHSNQKNCAPSGCCNTGVRKLKCPGIGHLL